MVVVVVVVVVLSPSSSSLPSLHPWLIPLPNKHTGYLQRRPTIERQTEMDVEQTFPIIGVPEGFLEATVDVSETTHVPVL